VKILVAIDAPINDYTKIKNRLSKYDSIIAADGAARHLHALSLIPNIIIGDFDSFKTIPKEWKSVELIKLPAEKDISDGELAINLAIEKGAKQLDLIGLTGGALDHTIANIEILKHISRNIDVNVVNEDEIIYRVTGKKEIDTMAGSRISIIDLTGSTILSTEGLKHELKNESLKTLTHGISNICKSAKTNISLDESGMILLFDYSSKQ
jgi:thiamine pyrophosphokinase